MYGSNFMREMKTSYIFGLLLLLFASCIKERDAADMRLSPYSESGSNSGGCLLNDIVWTPYCRRPPTGWGGYSDCQSLIISFDSLSDQTVIELTGRMVDDNSDVRIKFFLNDVVVRNYAELKALEGSVISLDGEAAKADLCFNEFPCSGTINCSTGPVTSFGRLYLRNVAEKYDNSGSFEYYVLSGTFGFDLTSPCWTYQAYKGRFDNEFRSFRAI